MSEIITIRARQVDKALEDWQVVRGIFEAFNTSPGISRFTEQGLVPVEPTSNPRVLDVNSTSREGEFDISINLGNVSKEELLLKFANLAHIISLVR